MRQDKQKRTTNEYYIWLFKKIRNCNSEEELDAVNDELEELHQARIIPKSYYDALSEELDDRLGTLIEEGKI